MLRTEDVKEINLDKLTFYVRQELDLLGINEQCAIDYERLFANRIVSQLKYEIAKQANIKIIDKDFKQTLKHKIVFCTHCPTSLWQMFKAKYMPKWFAKKYPVQYEQFEQLYEIDIPIHFACKVGIDVVYPDIVIPRNSYTANFRFIDKPIFSVYDDCTLIAKESEK